jgi:hypothetical protein
MADQAKVTQAIAQVETLPAPQLKAVQVAAQGETLPTPRLKASQLIAQVEVILRTAAGPTQEKLLRHGTWFDTTGKRRYWWAR